MEVRDFFNSIGQPYYIVTDVEIRFTAKISNVWAHGTRVCVCVCVCMYIICEVNYKNFILDHFNYNEFLNFWTRVRITIDKHMF